MSCYNASMRITTGIAKNKRLKVPNLETVKPTKEVVRDAIFNIIGSQIKVFNVGDFFSGSGSLGLEALSRGAKHVDFVEIDPIAAKYIQTNLNNLGFEHSGEVFEMDAEEFGDVMRPETFHLIIADPPYDYENWDHLITLAHQLLIPTGILILEHKENVEIQTKPGMKIIKTRKYGATRVTVFQKA